MYFTIWIEKIENHGEDALPTLLLQPPSTGVLAVYDGLGGAGSKTYLLQDWSNEPLSGAYLASRYAKQCLEHFFKKIAIQETTLIEQLTAYIKHNFQDFAQSLEGPPSRLKSKLIKPLPTTLAGLAFYPSNDESKLLIVNSFWAGDSRNYLLTDAQGLQQISKDDLNRQPDAMENIWQDATLSNCIDASGNFTIHQLVLEVASPCILLSATDGCFGYLPTPMHFEYILLHTLMSSFFDIEDWQEKLSEQLGLVAADDVSLSLCVIGFDSLNALKVHFFPRYQFIYHHFMASYDNIMSEEDKREEQKREALRQLWEDYKIGYYEMI